MWLCKYNRIRSICIETKELLEYFGDNIRWECQWPVYWVWIELLCSEICICFTIISFFSHPYNGLFLKDNLKQYKISLYSFP